MTIVLAHPSQSTLLTRRAGPAAAKRPSPPCWLAWQRDPAREVESLRTFYHRERSRAETIRQTVATRRRTARRSQSPRPPNEQVQSQVQPQPLVQPQTEPLPQPTNPTPSPTSERTQMLLCMYASLLDSRLQSVERVSKLLSDWQEHKPLPQTALPSSAFP